MRAQDAAKRVYDWIMHGTAVREARAALPRGDDRREAATRQAKLLLELARRVAEPSDVLPPGAQPPVLLGMYRDAIYWALAARRTGGDPPPADLKALWDASNPQLVAAAAAPDNADSAALRRTLFDDYDPRSLAVTDEDAARARAFAEALIWNLDAPRRRLTWVLTLRWLRIAAVAAAVLLVVGGVRSLTTPTDLAAGKPFRVSAPWAGWADCVAGGGCPGLMFHTETAVNPWVEIDLGAPPKKVQRVEVVNRGDCCADRAVPLIVELSTDQTTWTQVARRDEEFGTWIAKFRPKVARYVRLKTLKQTALHLRSIAVR